MILYEGILREFQRQKVKYIIVGGIAVNLLGWLRNTADMDILLEMSDENLAKAVKILKNKGYRVKQPVDPMGIADKKTREDWIKNKHMKAFNFYKEDELKEVDIIIDTPVPYEKAKKNIVFMRAEDIKLPVISIDDLIKMKKSTGRIVDKLDIEQLKKIKKLRNVK
jgi:hypothetical protein